MSSKPVKKVHYTASTKGSSVHGGSSFAPPLTSRPTSSTRRQSFSHQRQPSDSGVGSSSSNSASAQVNSASFFSDAERFEQRHNVAALNEAINTLKDRVQALEHENRELKNDLAESNRDRREMRRQCEDHLRTIEDLKKEKSRAKEGRDGKDSDGIRVRGSDVKITPEKERGERVAERSTPPMARREKEAESFEARRREEENLRAQHQARGRRASHRESQASPSPLYRSEERLVNPMTPNSRYRDERRNSATPASAKPQNPFAPIGPIGGRYGRREWDEVPYIRGEVPGSVHVEMLGRSRGLGLSGSWGSMNDHLYPNDGNYHLYPLEI
ncbi:hypothetical protein DSL72_007179 [Monilinia vaccinii-corymbosi]|uniref:Uncharacterized protein n=1 Tax=Monilinia vaccinii-corymbosi TaxID=61207 RepID=A0A8A3PM62_9HELO|nr:hypothetical protein DSL72_007179 [Monilinia vaccinii-corymbosi]